MAETAVADRVSSPVVVITPSDDSAGGVEVTVAFGCCRVVERFESTGSAGFVSALVALVEDAHKCDGRG